MPLTKSLADIKQEAKQYKNEHPQIKHVEALNIISQKYGYEKYEILKYNADKNNGMINLNIEKILEEEMSVAQVSSNLNDNDETLEEILEKYGREIRGYYPSFHPLFSGSTVIGALSVNRLSSKTNHFQYSTIINDILNNGGTIRTIDVCGSYEKYLTPSKPIDEKVFLQDFLKTNPANGMSFISEKLEETKR